MPHTSSQAFLRELDKKPWTAADKKGAQASCLSLQDGKAIGNEKATGKMPVLLYKIASTGKLIDDALEAVEKENPKLQIDPADLAGLIDLIATIPFQHADRNLPRHSAAKPGLAPNGSMALLLANCSMSSNSSGKGDIRSALVEADLVECSATIPKCCEVRQNCDKSYSFSLSN